MTKIAELVDIKSGYARYVNLVQTFEDETENRARMEQYMPVTSHRQAFERLSRALYPKDDRVYLLTGSYGTGKSHLCLMFANYLALKPGDPEMLAFFDNWAQRDKVGAEKLRNLRAEGRYLVALCEYGTSDDFDSIVLRAIAQACTREGVHDVWLDTEYQEAIRQIERWESRAQAGAATSAVFRAFQEELGRLYAGWTLEGLKEDLANYSQEARGVFKQLYGAVVGNEFTYSKDNLAQILNEFLANASFKARYKGLAIIADEFGDMLDRGAVRVSTFQRFAEMCSQEVSGSQLIFVGTAHKPFQAYGGGLSAVDFRVAADRVTEVPLQSEGLEDIFAAIVIPKKSHPAWEAEVGSHAGMFNRFVLGCTVADIFPHLRGPELRERIIENIYPMHPMATHCVIQLSREVGSNARSVFTFFSGAFSPGDGSYPWYVAETSVTKNDHLNLYTADLLTTYFQNELKPENTDAREAVRQHIRNHRASLREVHKRMAGRLDETEDPLVRRTLDLMLIYEIAGVANTAENLGFGLYCEEEEERKRLEKRLAMLVKDNILFRSASGVYEFRRSEAVDFEVMVEAYKADPNNQPADMAQVVTELVPLPKGEQWLEAKSYNLPYDEDKRLLRNFARPGALEATFVHEGVEVDYFTHQEQQMRATTAWKDSYEGVAVYVLCETDEEVQRARRLAEGNHSAYVIVGVPRQPIPIREAVMNLQAALHIQETEDLDSMSLQDRSRLQQDLVGDEQKGYKGEFLRIRRQYLSSKLLTWYASGGRAMVAQPSSEYEPADELMREHYKERTPFPHPYLNALHVARFGPGKDVALTDALNILLRVHRPLEIDHSVADSRGEIRFLKRCLADNGALVQKGPYQGTVAEYRLEVNPDSYRAKLPALAALVDQLRALAQGSSVAVHDLIRTYASDPYGQGPVAQSLYLAYVIRLFGDELRLQLQPGTIGWVTVQSADQIYHFVEGQHPNAVLERQKIGGPARALINGIHNCFAREPGAIGQLHTVGESFTAIHDWWSSLPNLAQAVDIYPPKTHRTARSLVELLAQAENSNPYSFVLEDLQTVYGIDAHEALTDKIVTSILDAVRADKATIETGPQRVKDALLPELMRPFAPASDLYGDYEAAIEAWYKDLDDGQRDPYSDWHNNQSQAIVQHLKAISNVGTTFFDKLPAHAGFGLGKVDDWHSDRSGDYVRMFHDGLVHIEANRVQVPAPSWEVQGKYAKKESTRQGARIVYRREAKLLVCVPESGVVVYLTDSGADPRDAKTQRQRVQDRFDLAINGSPDIKIVSQAQNGAYGQVILLSFFNEDTRYEPQPVGQPRLLKELGEEYKFIFPEDGEGLVVTIRSLLTSAIERGLLDKAVVIKLLAKLGREFGKKE